MSVAVAVCTDLAGRTCQRCLIEIWLVLLFLLSCLMRGNFPTWHLISTLSSLFVWHAVRAGGFLSQAYGWQAPFIALLVFSAGIIIPATLVCVRETHQYMTLQRLAPEASAAIKEAPEILSSPPRCGSPWEPITAVCDRHVVLHLLQATVGFACLISAQTELPSQLAAPPYNLLPGMIGVAYIASGGAGMIASPLGGKLFDMAAATSAQPMIRLQGNNLASLFGEFKKSSHMGAR